MIEISIIYYQWLMFIIVWLLETQSIAHATFFDMTCWLYIYYEKYVLAVVEIRYSVVSLERLVKHSLRTLYNPMPVKFRKDMYINNRNSTYILFHVLVVPNFIYAVVRVNYNFFIEFL